MIDYTDKRPIYEQLVSRYSELILTGALAQGSRMPSVRQLAGELSVTPNTIQRAYTALESAGLIYTVKGRGAFVAAADSLSRANKEDKAGRLLAALKEAAAAGISAGEAMDLVRKVYDGGPFEDRTHEDKKEDAKR